MNEHKETTGRGISIQDLFMLLNNIKIEIKNKTRIKWASKEAIEEMGRDLV